MAGMPTDAHVGWHDFTAHVEGFSHQKKGNRRLCCHLVTSLSLCSHRGLGVQRESLHEPKGSGLGF